MSAGFISQAEREMAERRAARSWLESRGFRVKQVNRLSTPVSHYQVTSVAQLLAPADFLAFARRQGWQGGVSQ